MQPVRGEGRRTSLRSDLMEGWSPDKSIVRDVIAGRQSPADLSHEDRSAVVAELAHGGESVALIALRLSCSEASVCRILAEPLTASNIRAYRAERLSAGWERRASLVDWGEVERLTAKRDALDAALKDAHAALMREQRRGRDLGEARR